MAGLPLERISRLPGHCGYQVAVPSHGRSATIPSSLGERWSELGAVSRLWITRGSVGGGCHDNGGLGIA